MNRTTQSHKPKVLLDRDIQNPRFDAGTLFEVLADDPYESKVKVQSLDPGDSGVILCNREILREVTSLEALVLLPVKPVRNRLKIYRDQEWLKEIPVISENKRVVVKDKFEGIVKFKGVVREYGPGIRFIVEIQDGTNDPIKRKQCFSIQDLRLLEGREIYHGILLCQFSAQPNRAAVLMALLHVAEGIGKRIACSACCHHFQQIRSSGGCGSEHIWLAKNMAVQPHSIMLLYSRSRVFLFFFMQCH